MATRRAPGWGWACPEQNACLTSSPLTRAWAKAPASPSRAGSRPMIRILLADASGVAEARRQAGAFAVRLGFDSGDAGRVELVATELATNIVKHGRGGQILVGDDEAGLTLLALDSGPGIANLSEALTDGFSSAGTPGTGLGAIMRQSQTAQIATWPGLGTAVLARLE